MILKLENWTVHPKHITTFHTDCKHLFTSAFFPLISFTTQRLSYSNNVDAKATKFGRKIHLTNLIHNPTFHTNSVDLPSSFIILWDATELEIKSKANLSVFYTKIPTLINLSFIHPSSCDTNWFHITVNFQTTTINCARKKQPIHNFFDSEVECLKVALAIFPYNSTGS